MLLRIREEAFDTVGKLREYLITRRGFLMGRYGASVDYFQKGIKVVEVSMTLRTHLGNEWPPQIVAVRRLGISVPALAIDKPLAIFSMLFIAATLVLLSTSRSDPNIVC